MLRKDEWLSSYFKGGAYQLSSSASASVSITEGFVYTKISTQDLTTLNTLVREGFNLVEISTLFEQQSPVQNHITSKNNIGLVELEEKEAILAIAENAFITSRFYQDTRIPHDTASKIKKDWVSNYFSGKRGDNLIVARIDKEVAGFLLLIKNTTIDLIAVSPKYYRQGIGSSMITFANQAIGLLKAGTQLNNHGSIAMYQKCGFLLTQSHFVLHKFLGKV